MFIKSLAGVTSMSVFPPLSKNQIETISLGGNTDKFCVEKYDIATKIHVALWALDNKVFNYSVSSRT